MHHYNRTIYMADTDAGGVVYHANYLVYADEARSTLLSDMGFSQMKLKNEHNIGLMVANCTLDLKYPLRIEDVVTIKTIIKHLSGVKIIWSHDYFLGEKHICHNETLLVCVDATTLRPTKMPQKIATLLSETMPK